MNRLEHLSLFSNAVLTPQFNCDLSEINHKVGVANYHCSGRLTRAEKSFRINWCKAQKKLIGEFGAVLDFNFGEKK